MRMTLTERQWAALDAAVVAEPRMRRWRRYRALQLRADGMTAEAVAEALAVANEVVPGARG